MIYTQEMLTELSVLIASTLGESLSPEVARERANAIVNVCGINAAIDGESATPVWVVATGMLKEKCGDLACYRAISVGKVWDRYVEQMNKSISIPRLFLDETRARGAIKIWRKEQTQ